MIPFAHGETVTRLRAGVVADPYSSQPTPAWELGEGQAWETEPTELAIPGCGFNPGDSSEPVQTARNAVITKPEVYAPDGADVLAGDRLVVRGVTYEVAGRPARWISPFTGWAPGLVIALDLVEG